MISTISDVILKIGDLKIVVFRQFFIHKLIVDEYGPPAGSMRIARRYVRGQSSTTDAAVLVPAAMEVPGGISDRCAE